LSENPEEEIKGRGKGGSRKPLTEDENENQFPRRGSK